LYGSNVGVVTDVVSVMAAYYDLRSVCVEDCVERYTVSFEQDGTAQFHPDPAARKLSTNLYDIHHCCVYSENLLMMDRGTVHNM
jgi:hypothetical protein